MELDPSNCAYRFECATRIKRFGGPLAGFELYRKVDRHCMRQNGSLAARISCGLSDKASISHSSLFFFVFSPATALADGDCKRTLRIGAQEIIIYYNILLSILTHIWDPTFISGPRSRRGSIPSTTSQFRPPAATMLRQLRPRSAFKLPSRLITSWERSYSIQAESASTIKLQDIDPSKLSITKTTTPKGLVPPNELVFGRTFTGMFKDGGTQHR